MEAGKTIFEVVRDARCARGLTQSGLAGLAGCRQSAISMFEGGRADALSHKTLAVIAGHLKLDAKTLSIMDKRAVTTRSLVLKYCPTDDCPSNIPYSLRGTIRFVPAMVAAPATEKTRCGFCGDVLEDRCPNPDCGTELNEGAFCRLCGTAYVFAGHEVQDAPDEWASKMRARILEVVTMSQTRRFTRRSGTAASPVGGNDQEISGGRGNVEE